MNSSGFLRRWQERKRRCDLPRVTLIWAIGKQCTIRTQECSLGRFFGKEAEWSAARGICSSGPGGPVYSRLGPPHQTQTLGCFSGQKTCGEGRRKQLGPGPGKLSDRRTGEGCLSSHLNCSRDVCVRNQDVNLLTWWATGIGSFPVRWWNYSFLDLFVVASFYQHAIMGTGLRGKYCEAPRTSGDCQEKLDRGQELRLRLVCQVPDKSGGRERQERGARGNLTGLVTQNTPTATGNLEEELKHVMRSHMDTAWPYENREIQHSRFFLRSLRI